MKMMELVMMTNRILGHALRRVSPAITNHRGWLMGLQLVATTKEAIWGIYLIVNTTKRTTIEIKECHRNNLEI